MLLSVTCDQMEVLKKLNTSASDTGKPYFGLPKLTLGYHEVISFRETHGKYGKSVVVELKDQVIFLPQYLVQQLNSKDIEDLNNSEETVFLYFGGKHEEKK